VDLIQKTRQFLADKKIDYLLVNATNEFLVEYCELSENSRYFLTNFSGSTGDALISQKDLFLFVDSRYHEQADLEVDSSKVSVVKLKLGQSFSEPLKKKMSKGKTLGVIAKNNSQGRLEILQSLLKDKNIKIELLDLDPVKSLVATEKPEILEIAPNIVQVDLSIAGVSAEEKLATITAQLSSTEVLFVTNLEEVSYLCNLRDFSRNYSSKIKAKCLITKNSAVLFTDEAIAPDLTSFEIKKMAELEPFVKSLDSVETFFADKNLMNIFDYNILESKSKVVHKDFIKDMKSIKNESEIEHYKKCFERTDKAIYAVREFIEQEDNLSENDIAKKLEESFYEFGAKSLSFKSIVAKDKNSALAHYSLNSKDEILRDGSLVLIDCGAYYEGGYATDCTRVFVKGTPSKLQKEVYTIVLKGFLAASNKKINPKTSGFSLDKAARKILEEQAPKGFAFSHALGHGIGINVHENPPTLGLSPLAKVPIKPNMCFTIEPGLYKNGFGGVRLENTFYMEEKNGELKVNSFANMCFEKKLIEFDLLSALEKKWLKALELR
jgi:Xaa-Pro aminopeptidase